ncbi:MAG: VWA domain-containing protein, partial [Muribaculaceae bacterium]|nr:VWA domain-containing protein [Muribaculaceae bacterium]
KKEKMAEISATLAFSSIQNNDKVGVIFFSDKIEKFIPPKKGRKHILLIIREIINFEPESRGTDVDVALRFLTNAIKKRSTAFLISDFIDDHDYFKSMTIANRKHDLAAIQVYDRRDAEMPDVGLIRIRDMETGADMWIDTSSKNARSNYAKAWYARQQKLAATTAKSGVDLASVTTDEDFVKSLLGLFRRRAVAR